MNIIANPPPGGILPVTGASGAVVSDASGTATLKGNVADSASAIGAIIDNAIALANAAALLLDVRNNNVTKLSYSTGGLLTAAGNLQMQVGSNFSLILKGNKAASNAGTDVTVNTSATRTAGLLADIQNNSSSKIAFDFNGKIVPASLPTVKAAGAAFCGSAALDTNGTVTIATTAVTANSLILCWMITAGGTVGGLYRAATADITAGTSFIIRSFVASTAGAVTAATTDTSTVGWLLLG